MCVNQKCLSVDSLQLEVQTKSDSNVCPSDCSGHGVCNSLGNIYSKISARVMYFFNILFFLKRSLSL